MRAWYPLGAPVVINASLSNDCAAARTSARGLNGWVTASLPAGHRIEVGLLEEGEPGTYANTIAGLTRGGYYLVRITARGSGFARERQLIFAMSPQTAAFAGAPRAHAQGAAGKLFRARRRYERERDALPAHSHSRRHCATRKVSSSHP